MICIVTKYAIKGSIAILQSPHMDWYHCYSWLKGLFVLNEQTISTCNTTNEYIYSSSHLIDIVHNLKLYISISIKTLNEEFCLILITQKFNLEVFLGFCFKNT